MDSEQLHQVMRMAIVNGRDDLVNWLFHNKFNIKNFLNYQLLNELYIDVFLLNPGKNYSVNLFLVSFV